MSALLALGALAAAPLAGAFGVYVTDQESAKVSQFSTSLSGVLAPLMPETVASGGDPFQLAISPDAKSVYVTEAVGGEISEYDIAPGGALTPKSPARVAVPGGAEPTGIAVSPDGTSVYVASYAGGISQYDVGAGGVLTPKVPATVPAGANPKFIAISPDGHSLYVTNIGDGTISEFDVGPGGLLAAKAHPSIGAGASPNRIAISPNGLNVYVTQLNGEAIWQYDVGANGVLTSKVPSSVLSERFSQGIAISPNGEDVFVASESGSAIEHYTVAAGGLLERLANTPTAKEGPTDLALSPDGRNLYTSVYYANAVNQYTVASGGLLVPKLPAIVLTEEHPGGIAVTPDAGPTAALAGGAAPVGVTSLFDASGSSGPYPIARYEWSFGDGTIVPGAAAVSHVYRAPGTYTVSVRVTDTAGCSAAGVFTGQTAYCNIDPGAIAGHTVTVAPASVVRPVISGTRQSSSRWRRGSKLARISRHVPVGDVFSFTLNERAAVKFVFYRQLHGRLAGARCVAPSSHNRHGRACLRSVASGTLAFTGRAGANKVAFQGRISRRKRLARGNYVMKILATNGAGRQGRPVLLRFTIVS